MESTNLETSKIQNIDDEIKINSGRSKKIKNAISSLKKTFKDLKDKKTLGAETLLFSSSDYSHAELIQEWVDKIISNKFFTPDAIKGFLENQNRDRRWKLAEDQNIIQAILTMQQSDNRVYFNNNMFKVSLHHYVYVGKIKISCLTNDLLTLLMNCDLVLSQNDPGFDVIRNCTLESVTITSDNFKIDEEPVCGYIQDYDPDFSAMCESDVSGEEIMNLIRTEQRQNDKFTYLGKEYSYCGNAKFSVVYDSNLSTEQLTALASNMKYLNCENNIVSMGEKRVPFNKGMYYVYNKLKPESFCPAYWYNNKDLEVNILFDFTFDYNYLYKLIEDKSKNGNLFIPENICYWGSLTSFFNFCAVMALTSQNLSPEHRKQLAGYADKYFQLRPLIRKLQENQLLLGRCYFDFFNCFLLNREFPAFLYLHNRLARYCEKQEILEKNSGFTDVKEFFENCDFCELIQRQLRPTALSIPKRLKMIISDYCTGWRLTTLASRIKSIAQEISALFPSNLFSDAAFPMLIPLGGLAVGEVNQNLVDTKVELRKEEVSKEKTKVKEKNKKESEAIVDKFDEIRQLISLYLALQLRKNMETKWRMRIEEKLINEISKNKRIAEQFNKAADYYITKKNKLKKNERMPVLDRIIDEVKKEAAKEKKAEANIGKPIETETPGEKVAKEEKAAKAKKNISKKRKRSDDSWGSQSFSSLSDGGPI